MKAVTVLLLCAGCCLAQSPPTWQDETFDTTLDRRVDWYLLDTFAFRGGTPRY